MTLTRWEPFRDMLGLQGRLSQMLSENSALWNEDDASGSWMPSVDIFEKGDDLVIRAELPGVDGDEIDVRVENNTLLLNGERRKDVESTEGKVYRRERVFGSFTRRFSLPTTVDASKISASHTNGILEIVLPKLEEAKPRRVEIRTA